MEIKKPEKTCKIYKCETCEYVTRDKQDYNRHLSTRKHKRKQMETNVSPNFQCSNCDKTYKTRAGLWKHKKTCTFINEEKESNNNGENSVTPEMFMELMKVVVKQGEQQKKFHCEKCDYRCCYLSDWNKHLSTRKHKMVVNGSKLSKKSEKKYFCECGKSYSHDSGYYRHKKTCTFINEEKDNNNNNNNSSGNGGNVVTTEMFMELMKVVVKQGEQQNNFQNKIVEEIIPKIGNTNCHNTTNNTTNKFNMNFFLNETCKDAIPLVEFISNLKLTVEDLDNTGKEGLVKGLTDIITKGLNELDITKRPIHCSDIKRETLYIKNEDKWIKDDKNKTIVDKENE